LANLRGFIFDATLNNAFRIEKQQLKQDYLSFDCRHQDNKNINGSVSGA
jgi:hypothetical protein